MPATLCLLVKLARYTDDFDEGGTGRLVVLPIPAMGSEASFPKMSKINGELCFSANAS